MLSREEQRFYLDQNVNILLKPLLVEILKNKPEKMVDFMVQWLETKGREFEQFGVLKKEA